MALTCCVSCKQFRDSSNRKLLAFSVELLSIIVNKTSKTLYTRIWVNKAFFTPFNYFSELSKFFLAKLLITYLKYYISLVSYQKSEKSNDWLPRNARKCIFFTPISPFLAKKIFFFENRAPSVFRSSKKLPWYQKSENSNEPFEWNLPD